MFIDSGLRGLCRLVYRFSPFLAVESLSSPIPNLALIDIVEDLVLLSFPYAYISRTLAVWEI